ncbi:MAG: hypothetical protein C0611_04045, partial [Desulfobacteraceae bacterium]
VLRGFPVAAYRRTPHRKPLCGLDQNKNCSFLNWTSIVFILNSWMDTNQPGQLGNSKSETISKFKFLNVLSFTMNELPVRKM